MNREQQGVILFLSLFLCFLFFLIHPWESWKGRVGLLSDPKASTGKAKEEGFPVDVEGSVIRRGIIQAEAGLTVWEVLEKAGGIQEKLSLPAEVLAQKIDRSSRLRVFPEGGGKGRVAIEPLAAPQLKVLSVPLSINTATAEELDGLPGVGPKIAQAIVEYRKTHGLFTFPEDLLLVPGIGPKKLAALRSHITLP
jgi:competence protein ComEA